MRHGYFRKSFKSSYLFIFPMNMIANDSSAILVLVLVKQAGKGFFQRLIGLDQMSLTFFDQRTEPSLDQQALVAKEDKVVTQQDVVPSQIGLPILLGMKGIQLLSQVYCVY